MNEENAELLSGFVDYLRQTGKANCTVISYAGDIRQWLNFLGEVSGLQAEENEVKAFLQKMKTLKANEKTLSRKINALHTFYRSLVKNGKILADPSGNIRPPKVKNNEARILTKMEYRALRDTVRGNLRLAAIIEVLLQTGIRIAELAGLKIRDIKEDKLNINGRIIQLTTTAKQCVNNYLQTRGRVRDDAPLFATKTGKQLLIRNIRTLIDRGFEKAGIKEARVNDLRSTWINYQLASGVDPRLVAEIAGHKRLASTTKYFKEEEKKNYKKRVVEL